jgi:hypothetical protein
MNRSCLQSSWMHAAGAFGTIVTHSQCLQMIDEAAAVIHGCDSCAARCARNFQMQIKCERSVMATICRSGRMVVAMAAQAPKN